MSEPATRSAPIELWRIAEAFLKTLFALFGTPDEVAQRHTLVRSTHTLMAKWIAAGEALMRRLLLIEAAAFRLEAVRPGKPKPRVRKPFAFYPDKPDEWRVHFNTVPCSDPEPTKSSRRGKPGIASRFCSAWPLALRLEALLRVFNEPHVYARRIARRLARSNSVHHRMMQMREELRPLVGAEHLREIEARVLAPNSS